MKKALLFLSFMLVVAGCQQQQPVVAATTPAPTPIPQRPQRFVPVAAEQGGLALDTETGILCRTWNWTPTSKQQSTSKVISEWSPLCVSLYTGDFSNENVLVRVSMRRYFNIQKDATASSSLPLDELQKPKP